MVPVLGRHSRQPLARLSQVWDDNVSKVTLPAWPRQGYGRYWLSSGLLIQFVSCPYSDLFDLLYDLDLCIVYLYSWLIGVVVVIYVSCGLYCNPVVMLPLVLILWHHVCDSSRTSCRRASQNRYVRISAESLESSWYRFQGITGDVCIRWSSMVLVIG